MVRTLYDAVPIVVMEGDLSGYQGFVLYSLKREDYDFLNPIGTWKEKRRDAYLFYSHLIGTTVLNCRYPIFSSGLKVTTVYMIYAVFVKLDI